MLLIYQTHILQFNKDDYLLSDYVSSISTSGSYLYIFGVSLHVFNIQDPSSLIEICDYYLPQDTQNTSYDLSVLGSYVYLSSGNSGLYIIDVSNPASPIELTHYDKITAFSLLTFGSLAYVSDRNNLSILNSVIPRELMN